ncbi:hypothetical protein KAW38_01390 [Candidatus Micrarchaeota archaeon]|nr:hypothetical protein [Candidatus Micrarchaeota archaeon]
MDIWKKYKKKKLEGLEEAIREKKADSIVIPLLNKINEKEGWVTTSSCAGRISLLSMEESKKDAEFYKKWHREIELNEFEEALKEYKWKKPLWFRVESLILHVICRDLSSAEEFFRIGRKAGVKHGGIIPVKEKRYMVELMGTPGMIIPIKECENAEWERIIGMGNKILKRNYERLEKLGSLI